MGPTASMNMQSNIKAPNAQIHNNWEKTRPSHVGSPVNCMFDVRNQIQWGSGRLCAENEAEKLVFPCTRFFSNGVDFYMGIFKHTEDCDEIRLSFRKQF